MSAGTVDWVEVNQRCLVAALDEVRRPLEAHVARVRGPATASAGDPEPRSTGVGDGTTATPTAGSSALDSLCAGFALSPFERQLLVLCAGVELDAAFAGLCAEAKGDGQDPWPTFGLALSALSEPHWSAITPAAPLRHWRLVEVGQGASLTTAQLRIDERVLHHLAGVQQLDERLAGLLDPVAATEELADSHQQLVERLVRRWTHEPVAEVPVLQLCGTERTSKRTVAATVCARLDLTLWSLPAALVPVDPAELDALCRLWEREAVLGASALLVICDDDPGDAARTAAVDRFLTRVRGPVLVSSRERRSLPERTAVAVEVAKPTRAEQRSAWRRALGGSVDDAALAPLVAQFDLSLASIHEAHVDVADDPAHDPADDLGGAGSVGALWDACRVRARPRLDDLAQRVESGADWTDLVLPPAQMRVLHDVVTHVRHRRRVYEDWGFARKSARGLGIGALFAGPSGTGKTLAAEVLAEELRLDLYRIDLSQVVSKYIGETEKNLRRVFDAAEDGGTVLLFDEADALFGKRSEVKDSHDRYANIEVGYLLQRMEDFAGLAILTTNLKDALDPAFLRRLRFVVHFPFPDAQRRAEIWRRVFPAQAPTEALDAGLLARLNIAGGNIRNIALHAMFLAAEADQPVRMAHLLRAARGEYAKLDRPLTDAETAGWM